MFRFLSLTVHFVVLRQHRLFWWWWWSSVSPGCPITWCISGWSLVHSLWTRRPSYSVWWLTVWPTATPLLTPSSTLSSRKTSGKPTGRCSSAKWLLNARRRILEKQEKTWRKSHPLTAPCFNLLHPLTWLCFARVVLRWRLLLVPVQM